MVEKLGPDIYIAEKLVNIVQGCVISECMTDKDYINTEIL